jgi:hypothetical protein
MCPRRPSHRRGSGLRPPGRLCPPRLRHRPRGTGELEGHASTFGPQVPAIVLDNPPTRVCERGAVMLQHVDVVFGHHEVDVASPDTAAVALDNVLD